MKVLILEDTDERIRKFKQRLIGHEVTIVKKADECIHILSSSNSFDYIMMDHDLATVFEKPGKGTGYC